MNSRAKLDQQRASAGIEAYRKGRLYDPADALTLLEEASYFDASLVPLVLKLRGSTAKRFASWTMVVNAAAGSGQSSPVPRNKPQMSKRRS